MNFLFYFWVFAGGMIGSILREVLAPLFPAQVDWLPILIINTLAAFVIGFVYGIEQRLHNHLKTFYAIGFCGGFSTFSHFSYQTVNIRPIFLWSITDPLSKSSCFTIEGRAQQRFL